MTQDLDALPLPEREVSEVLDSAFVGKSISETKEALEQLIRAKAEQKQEAFSKECDDADELLRLLGLDPESCRTDGGFINMPRVRSFLEDRKQALAAPAQEQSISKAQEGREPVARLTREQIDAIMTHHYPLDSLLRESVDAFESCVRDIEKALFTSPPPKSDEPIPVTDDASAVAYLEWALWKFIDMAGMWPSAKVDPRTWAHVMVYAPKSDARMVERLKSAIEGECDGLAIDNLHAQAILDCVLVDSVQPTAPNPAPPAYAPKSYRAAHTALGIRMIPDVETKSDEARDAERYRWLRAQHEGHEPLSYDADGFPMPLEPTALAFTVFRPDRGSLEPVGCIPGELDATIDAALSAQQKGAV